jgi:hypothetical protein
LISFIKHSVLFIILYIYREEARRYIVFLMLVVCGFCFFGSPQIDRKYEHFLTKDVQVQGPQKLYVLPPLPSLKQGLKAKEAHLQKPNYNNHLVK